MAGGGKLHGAQVVLATYFAGKKLAEGQWAIEHVCGKIRHKKLTKDDDISDLVSEKNKDNFQIFENMLQYKLNMNIKLFSC